ncbi:MAG: methionine adenosyltransferase domain-containing protein, partial [Oscillospiraceae bacterium]|nr:methionine adenosyltransferase domain-containing protein [Oscillospiraceae bacterium]
MANLVKRKKKRPLKKFKSILRRRAHRSGAYMARWITRVIAAQGLAKRCEVQMSYGIGLANPMSLRIDTFGTAKGREFQLHRAVARTVEECVKQDKA